MFGLVAPLPLAFSRVVHSRKFWLAWGAIVGLAALCALLVGVADAISVGTVSLPAHRGGRPRVVVPWPAAWAYFSGWVFAVAAAVLLGFITPDARQERLRGVGALCAVASFFLTAISTELSSLWRAGFMLAVATLFGLVLCVARRFGKWTAVAAWIGVVGCVVLSFAPG